MRQLFTVEGGTTAQGAPLRSELCVFPGYSEWLPVGEEGCKPVLAAYRGEAGFPTAGGNTLIADERCLGSANCGCSHVNAAAPAVTADITNQL